MQCNIDAKGRLVRLAMGVVALLAAAVVLVGWSIPSGSTASWIAFGVLLAVAALGIGQGWAGICVVRAMGFKTQI